MVSIGIIFTSTYHTKKLNLWPNSSGSHVLNYSQLSSCQGEMELFEDHPSTCGHLTSHSKSSLSNFQYKYLHELLVNVYTCCLMVKSVSCCCVCGSLLFSNPVTNVFSRVNAPKQLCKFIKCNNQLYSYVGNNYSCLHLCKI